MNLTINFNDVSEAQAIAIIKAAKIMEWCGKIGASRNIKFFADGDGDFRPKVTYNSSSPIRLTDKKLSLDLLIMENMHNHSDFYIDYDDTAWQLEENINLTKEAEKEYDELSKIYSILI